MTACSHQVQHEVAAAALQAALTDGMGSGVMQVHGCQICSPIDFILRHTTQFGSAPVFPPHVARRRDSSMERTADTLTLKHGRKRCGSAKTGG